MHICYWLWLISIDLQVNSMEQLSDELKQRCSNLHKGCKRFMYIKLPTTVFFGRATNFAAQAYTRCRMRSMIISFFFCLRKTSLFPLGLCWCKSISSFCRIQPFTAMHTITQFQNLFLFLWSNMNCLQVYIDKNAYWIKFCVNKWLCILLSYFSGSGLIFFCYHVTCNNL